MRKIAVLVVVLMSSGAFAQPAGSGSGPAAGSSSEPAAGSGSAPPAPAPTPAPTPAPSEPNPAARQACVEAMNADPAFADRIIKTAEAKLQDRVNDEQVAKDICALRDHMDSQADVATNKKHVLMAYIAMWLVAAGFIFFLWNKQQKLKLEIANLRRDLDDATKDGK